MNKASTSKVERKISETILDFGEPLLSEVISEDTPVAVVREIYKIIVLVWNAHVAASSRWNDPSYLHMLQQIATSPPDAAGRTSLDREALESLAGAIL